MDMKERKKYGIEIRGGDEGDIGIAHTLYIHVLTSPRKVAPN